MPQNMLNDKRVILAKAETTYGVDPIPVAANAILCRSLTVSPRKSDVKERANIRPYFGTNAKVVTAQHGTIDIEVECAVGGNAAGEPLAGAVPQWDVLMTACGFRRTVTATAVQSTLQADNTANTVTLNASASAVDDFYAGMTLYIASESGTAQAPTITGDRTKVKLSASFTLLSGTSGTGTTTTVNFTGVAGVSSVDDFYTGQQIMVQGETVRTISAYDGTTKIATVSVALTAASSAKTFTVIQPDSYFYDHQITITHFSGSKRVGETSTQDYIFLPTAVTGAALAAGATLDNLMIKVTSGGNTEIRRIKKADLTSGKCTFFKALSFGLSGATTFVITETRRVTAYNAATREVTTQGSLRFATTAASLYEVGVNRLITNYVGATKKATVTPNFKNTYRPKSGDTYQLNANVKYSPVSSGLSSIALYFYLDDVLHSFLGARGSVSIDFMAGDIPVMKFSLQGLIDKYENNAITGVDLSGFVTPLPVNNDNTKNFIIDGYEDIVAEKLSLDVNNTVAYRNLINAEAVLITDRNSKGSINIEATRPGDFDFFNRITNMYTSQLGFTHGPLGQQVSVFAPKAQLSNPQYGEKDGITMLQLDIDFLPQGTGNNELAIILQ